MKAAERLNAYTCEICRGTMVTVDREPGVTPFLVSCQVTTHCTGMAMSGIYLRQFGTPTHEWRKPTTAERARLSVDEMEHVDRGGLLLYRIPAQARR